MGELAKDYLVLMFVACVGTIQAASAYANLRGLFLIPSRRVTGGVGLLVAVAAFIWFFASGDRNLPDTDGGLAGAQQFVFFVAMCAAAIAVTYLVSSLVNGARRRSPEAPADGFLALQHLTVLQVWAQNLGWIRRRWLSLTRKSFSG